MSIGEATEEISGNFRATVYVSDIIYVLEEYSKNLSNI